MEGVLDQGLKKVRVWRKKKGEKERAKGKLWGETKARG